VSDLPGGGRETTAIRHRGGQGRGRGRSTTASGQSRRWWVAGEGGGGELEVRGELEEGRWRPIGQVRQRGEEDEEEDCTLRWGGGFCVGAGKIM
jgi:hypothetical protein